MDDKDRKIDELKRIIHDKDYALEHALNRLETIQLFSGSENCKHLFNGVHWESGQTITRIKMALKLKP